MMKYFALLSVILFSWVQIQGMELNDKMYITTSSDNLSISLDALPGTGADLGVKITSAEDGRIIFDEKISFLPVGGKYKAYIMDLEVNLWTPAHPHLYHIEIYRNSSDDSLPAWKERIGFRDIETRDGKIWLNGKPLFLRGIAINPPGRGIPKELEESREFALEYVKFMKSIYVNIIRIPDNEDWYDVCDELGMLVFGGNYSGSVKGELPPKNYKEGVEWYKNTKFQPIMHHPSLVIYALTNEVPYKGEIAQKWIDFLSYAHKELKKWDSSRLYIGNAGYGYGQSGDICDLHRYWGWYYSSPYTFLNIRDYERITFPDRIQPLTFTECVGNYTGPDGRYNLTPNHKNPVSQLNWTGHAPQKVQQLLADEHQAWTIKEATELTRRLRRINSESSGIFPFTILFRNWHTAQSFVDMDAKPAIQQFKLSYQPVLLSWESWTTKVYAGSTIQPVVHIINDSDELLDLVNNKLIVRLLDKSLSVRYADTVDIPGIEYYDIYSEEMKLQLPETLFTGYYTLEGILLSEGREVSRNSEELFIAQQNYGYPSVNSDILLYDPDGATKEAFRDRGIPFLEYNGKNYSGNSDLLVIGKNACDEFVGSRAKAIRKQVAKGGRLLIMSHDSLHQEYLGALLPVAVKFPQMDIDDPRYPPPARPSRNGFNVNPERPGHPLFSGISRKELKVWSDYTGWDESQKGMPAIYPVTQGFILERKEDIEHTAILANYSVGLEGIACAEFFEGKGSVLLSGFDLVGRLNFDPVADRMMSNMIRYMASDETHQPYVCIEEPVTWGEYETEQGLLTGIYSGFMINAKPALYGSYEELEYRVDEFGHGYAGAKWGWNNRAGKQYVPYGRRIFGPYYHRDFGGIPTPADPGSESGKAFFWCKVPKNTNAMSNLVWNPSDEEIPVLIAVNGSKVETMIGPGEYRTIDVPVPASDRVLKVMFEGDRRAVVLESTFY